jgi:hypothetical protein
MQIFVSISHGMKLPIKGFLQVAHHWLARAEGASGEQSSIMSFHNYGLENPMPNSSIYEQVSVYAILANILNGIRAWPLLFSSITISEH